MGNDKSGSSRHQPVHPFRNDPLCPRIDGGCRLVENQCRRVGYGRAGNGEQLSLPLGKVAAVSGQNRLVAVRQLADEEVRICKLRGGYDFLVGRIQFPITDIFHDSSRKQMRILQNHTKGTPQISLPDLVHIDPVITDLPVLDVIEAVDQIRNRRLSGSGGSDKSDLLARLRVEGDIMQNHSVRHIAKVHVVHDDRAFQRLVICGIRRLVIMLPGPAPGMMIRFPQLSVSGPFRVHKHDVALILFGLGVQKIEDTLRAGHRHDDGGKLVGDLGNRHSEGLVQSQERGQRSQCESPDAPQRQSASCNCAQDITQVPDLPVQRSQDIGIADCLVRGLIEFLIQLIKNLLVLFLMTEDLHYLLPVHHLFNKAVHGSEGILLLNKMLLGNPGAFCGRKHRKRNHGEGQQGQRQGKNNHGRQSRNHRDDRLEDLGDRLGDQLAHGIDVIGVNRHDISVGMLVKIADRKAFHMIEQIFPKVPHTALGNVNHRQALRERRGNSDGIKQRDSSDRPRERAEIRVRLGNHRNNIRVDQSSHKEGSLEIRENRNRDRRQNKEELEFIPRHDILQDSPQKLPRMIDLRLRASCPSSSAGSAACGLNGSRLIMRLRFPCLLLQVS